MRVVFTPEANEQADNCDTWWRENRTKNRDLFARELAETKRLLLETPNVGIVHAVLDGLPVRRILLPKTRTHLINESGNDRADGCLGGVEHRPAPRKP